MSIGTSIGLGRSRGGAVGGRLGAGEGGGKQRCGAAGFMAARRRTRQLSRGGRCCWVDEEEALLAGALF